MMSYDVLDTICFSYDLGDLPLLVFSPTTNRSCGIAKFILDSSLTESDGMIFHFGHARQVVGEKHQQRQLPGREELRAQRN
jgi:hypothetical protein